MSRSAPSPEVGKVPSSGAVRRRCAGGYFGRLTCAPGGVTRVDGGRYRASQAGSCISGERGVRWPPRVATRERFLTRITRSIEEDLTLPRGRGCGRPLGRGARLLVPDAQLTALGHGLTGGEVVMPGPWV